MASTTVVGIDPGLVHTGLVAVTFDDESPKIIVTFSVVIGQDHPSECATRLDAMGPKPDHIFVEKYRDRGNNYVQDADMRALERLFVQQFPGAVLVDNIGSKRIVRQSILDVLGLYGFPTTHHRDLEAAARILVFGMLKDDELNKLVYKIICDHLDGQPWPIRT